MKKSCCTNRVLLRITNAFKHFLPAFFFLLFCFNSAKAQTVTVTTTADALDGNTGSIALLNGTPGGAGISLREAVRATNNEPEGATITINLPAGNYSLTLTGAAEQLAATGDLDFTGPASGTKIINIVGAGAGTTTITGSGDRILDLEPSNTPGDLTVNISGVTFTGGNLPSASGGAILAGFLNNVTNINNCVFANNTAPSNGGAISQSSAGTVHTLTITNTTFTNNTATAAVGGAVSYNGVGNVTITGCTFTGNTAGTQGGAINISGTAPGPVTTNILRNTFTGNTANGATFGGAAVAMVNAQTMNINFNRIVGNTAASVATGKMISTGGGAVTAMNTNNNWWGVNTGPAAADILGTAAANWLQLKNTAAAGAICNGATKTITADFLTNSAAAAISPADLTALVGQPITFNAPVNGTLSSAQTTIQAAGTATVTFTATAAGSGTANAVFVPLLENTTVTTSPAITINTSPSITLNPSASTACLGLPVSFTGGASNQTSLVWQESSDAGFTSPVTLTNTGVYSGATTTTLSISDNSALDGKYYRLVAINSNGCPNANSTGALLTVTAPTMPTGHELVVITANTNNNLFYAPPCRIVEKIVPSGATPISGNIAAETWREASVLTYGGQPYVQRHYQATPSAGSTGTVTLYFTQIDFDNFNAHPSSTLNLPVDAADALNNKANLRISKYNGSTNNGTGLPGSYTGGGLVINPPDANIVWNGTFSRWEVTFDVSGFSGFFVQTFTFLLPVNLISFSAQKASNDIQLKWQTADESNNDHFELERSFDGRTFTGIGQRAGNNGTGIKNYDWLDAGAASSGTSKIFYRLKIVSFSGSVEYSNTVVVYPDKQTVVITGVNPNPFTDKLNISLNMPGTGKVTMKLTDMTGRLLRNESIQAPKGFSTHTMKEMEKLGAGLYILTAEFEGQIFTYKIKK